MSYFPDTLHKGFKMKSIVEEASSLAKAIENGWVRAGKPEEFTVRIFEEPEKNFLGFSKKPAKVGIFYKEPIIQQPARGKDQKQAQVRPLINQKNLPEKARVEQKPKLEQRPLAVSRQQTAVKTAVQPTTKTVDAPKAHKWSPELMEGSKEWINVMLKTIKKEDIQFTIEPQQYFLTINFAKPILQDKRKEQLLFRNWAHLLLQVLRHRFKHGLRGYKIIIKSAA